MANLSVRPISNAILRAPVCIAESGGNLFAKVGYLIPCLPIRDVRGNGIPDGNRNPKGMGMSVLELGRNGNDVQNSEWDGMGMGISP